MKYGKWIINILILFIVLSVINEVIIHFVFNFSARVFIYIPLTFILFIGGVLLLLFSIVHFLRERKNKNLLSLILSLVLLFLLIDRPLSPILRKTEFSFKIEEREEVANQILNKEIQPSNTHGNLFIIPGQYKNSFLSDGKEVMEINNRLLFFTSRAILDNFSGYVFSPDGSEPTNENVNATIIKIQKMNNNWYYISCT